MKTSNGLLISSSMTAVELGYDTTLTFEILRTGGRRDTFTIRQMAIFWRKSIASSCSMCFHLTREGDDELFYVLKDDWPSCGHNSEVELLRIAQTAGVNALTKYLAYRSPIRKFP